MTAAGREDRSARELELGEALAALRARLARAAEAAGRDVADIELLPVTKFFPAADVVALHRLGCGRSANPATRRRPARSPSCARSTDCAAIRWHMVGRIQRNKARSIGEWAYAAHSVDSLKVVTALDRAAAEALDRGARAATPAGVSSR